MKTPLLLITLLLCRFCAAQSAITLLPADTNTFLENVDLSDPFGYVSPPPSIAIQNNTNDTLNIVWTREIPAGCPLAWEFQVSDIYDDYVPWISSNVNNYLSRPLPLLPQDTIEYIQVNLWHNGTAGCCNVAMHFSEFSAPDSTLATAYFNFRINDPDCLLVDVEEEREDPVRIYPNPTTGLLFVESPEEIQQMEVYDIRGISVRTFESPPFELGDLAAGLYWIRIRNTRGKVRFFRILKQ